MPMLTSFGEATFSERVDGLYQHLYDRAVEASKQADPRLVHADFTPRVDAAGRRMLNAASPATKSAHRKVASFEAREPQLVPVRSMPFGVFPDLAAVPFLSQEVRDTQDEYDERAWLVRVYADDAIEVGQTRAQAQEQSRLISEGYTMGRVEDNGDYQPLGLRTETGSVRAD